MFQMLIKDTNRSHFERQRSSHVEVVQVNDRGQKPSQDDFIEVTFLPQPNHDGPGPESNDAMDGVIKDSPEPQMVLDEGERQKGVDEEAESAQACAG